VTALLIMLALWLGSGALVVPYLLYVARVQVDQAVSQGAERHKLSGESGSIRRPTDAAFLCVPGAFTGSDDSQIEDATAQTELVHA
jgi:hypothetical protein